MSNKVCFIIAHKYYRGYHSFLKYYIENIQKFYPEALTVVVDNNSKYPEDVFGPLRGLSNVVFLTNDYEGKFELGAYKVGTQYVIDNGLVDDYTYFVCTQDNFILKNFFDFSGLAAKKTYALPINSMFADKYGMDACNRVLDKIGLNDNWDKINFCWCVSFVVANHKVKQLNSYLATIQQKTRHESEAAERYLARILWELNERCDCGSIDGDCRDLINNSLYHCWHVDLYAPVNTHFAKRVQQKNENTKDAE
jgi:hypothetical protein